MFSIFTLFLSLKQCIYYSPNKHRYNIDNSLFKFSTLFYILRNMISITQQAKDKLITEKKKNQLSSAYYVRISVEEGGCEGMKYAIKFDKNLQQDDTIVQENDLSILIKKDHIPYLQNIRLNYAPDHEQGFFFDNPNAKSTCGCGKSFSI